MIVECQGSPLIAFNGMQIINKASRAAGWVRMGGSRKVDGWGISFFRG
jgi:hypothetical protein